DAAGSPLAVDLVPFARSVAGAALSLQQPSAMNRLHQTAATSALELQPFERGRHSLLTAPLSVAPGTQVILELFDKQGPEGDLDEDGFTAADHRLVGAAADVGAEMLRRALAERPTHHGLFHPHAAALRAGGARRLGWPPRKGEGRAPVGTPRGGPPFPTTSAKAFRPPPGRPSTRGKRYGWSRPSGSWRCATVPPPCNTAPAWWKACARCS